MRVLVVEDEKKTASFIRKALQSEGYAVDMLHDGAEALAAVGHTPFDVVVLDVMLPGRDGLSVVRQMRERKMAIPADHWCAWQDLNLHGFRHYHLKVACLPIPPHAQPAGLLKQAERNGASAFLSNDRSRRREEAEEPSVHVIRLLTSAATDRRILKLVGELAVNRALQ